MSEECALCALGPDEVGALELTPPAGALATEAVAWSDDHYRPLAEVPADRVRLLVDVWAERYRLHGDKGARAVLVAEDAGATADGVSHRHSTVWAAEALPPRMRDELRTATDHLHRTGNCRWCDAVGRERADDRVVVQNASFLAFVPDGARTPFEVEVLAHRHATSLLDLSDPERAALAEVLHAVLGAYTDVLGPLPPYALALHQAPHDDGASLAVSHLRVELTPDPMRANGALGLGWDVHRGGIPAADAARRLRAAVQARRPPKAVRSGRGGE